MMSSLRQYRSILFQFITGLFCIYLTAVLFRYVKGPSADEMFYYDFERNVQQLIIENSISTRAALIGALRAYEDLWKRGEIYPHYIREKRDGAAGANASQQIAVWRV